MVDDQQRHRGQQFHVLFAFPVEGRIRDFLEQDMRFTVDHPIALADDRFPDSLGQVTLAGTSETGRARTWPVGYWRVSPSSIVSESFCRGAELRPSLGFFRISPPRVNLVFHPVDLAYPLTLSTPQLLSL